MEFQRLIYQVDNYTNLLGLLRAQLVQMTELIHLCKKCAFFKSGVIDYEKL